MVPACQPRQPNNLVDPESLAVKILKQIMALALTQDQCRNQISLPIISGQYFAPSKGPE